MSAVVESDKKGKDSSPCRRQTEAHSKRFKVVVVKDHVELHPLPGVQSVKGKYRNVIKSEREELEEKAEELVAKQRRRSLRESSSLILAFFLSARRQV